MTKTITVRVVVVVGLIWLTTAAAILKPWDMRFLPKFLLYGLLPTLVTYGILWIISPLISRIKSNSINWKKGASRLWIIISVVWIGYVFITSKIPEAVEPVSKATIEKKLLNAIQTMKLEPVPEFNTPPNPFNPLDGGELSGPNDSTDIILSDLKADSNCEVLLSEVYPHVLRNYGENKAVINCYGSRVVNYESQGGLQAYAPTLVGIILHDVESAILTNESQRRLAFEKIITNSFLPPIVVFIAFILMSVLCRWLKAGFSSTLK